MNRITFFIVVFLEFITSCLAVTSYIIPPIRSTCDEVGLIFIPGAYIDGLAYQKTAVAIQQASNLKLWVALTGNFTAGIVNPVELPGAIEGSIMQLQQRGMKSSNFVAVGHSLGGVFLESYAKGNSVLKAIILLAAFVRGDTQLKDYPMPVLTLSAELDGQTRITRIALDYEELQQDVKISKDSMYRTPVINIKGSNHAQFASGPMPSRVRQYDLQPDISEAEAHAQIGKHCSNFITSTFGTMKPDVEKTRKGLEDAYVDSALRFQPLLDVKALDKSKNSSPWAGSAQALFAGEWLDRVNITDLLLNDEEFVLSKPNITKTGQGIRVDTTSYIEYQLNPTDIPITLESPWEIDVKMKSQEAIAEALKTNWSIGEVPTCLDINKLAFQVAFENATADSQTRYKTRGRPITFVKDIVYETGIQWVSKRLQMTESDAGLRVQSVALMTSTKSPILPGMFYCKLLSPYRAMEWIVVDSLRKKKP